MPTSFPLVRGRTMRVTRVDGCCAPLFGDDNMIVTDGFVSVALTANITEPEEIVVTNANGQTCVRDPGCPEFNGYGVELTFCDVNPCLFAIVTGQPAVLDANGDVIGFRMNSDTSVCGVESRGFALEVWMGVPGVACLGQAGAFGYLLLPCLQAGVIGDFTIENAAVTFTITGASTKDGNGWNVGPYDVMADANGNPGPLANPLDGNDHLLVAFTTVGPPDPTDGCVALDPPDNAATGATEVAGAAGTWTPSGSVPPANVPNLIAGSPVTVAPSPSTAWTTGSYMQTATAGTGGQAHWNGTQWVGGVAP